MNEWNQEDEWMDQTISIVIAANVQIDSWSSQWQP